MVADHTAPWEPHRRQANAIIAILGVAILGLLLWRISLVHRSAPAERITAQARLWELQGSVKALATSRLKGLLPRDSMKPRMDELSSPWDRALMAVLAAEDGDPELGRALAMKDPVPAGRAGEIFRRCFSSAYLAQGDPPSPTERAAVSHALRDGFAARMLEARLRERSDPGSAQRLRDEAQAWAIPRLAGLAAAGVAFTLLVPCGIAMALVLAFSPKTPRPFPIPAIRMSGRGLAIVFLSWFLIFLLSGAVIGSLVAIAPVLHPYLLPLSYGFHALAGIGLLCRAEDLSLAQFLKRLMPGYHWKSLAWGLGFLALAVVMVLAVSLTMSPFLKQQESPQRELMDLVAGVHGVLPLGALFVTIAFVAPVFEECLFRGTLLPWLGHRLKDPMGERAGWSAALVATSLGFGLIHLQPIAVPVLSTLGLALGFAFLRTRNLLTAILVHGLWNGGVFLFYRVVFG